MMRIRLLYFLVITPLLSSISKCTPEQAIAGNCHPGEKYFLTNFCCTVGMFGYIWWCEETQFNDYFEAFIWCRSRRWERKGKMDRLTHDTFIILSWNFKKIVIVRDKNEKKINFQMGMKISAPQVWKPMLVMPSIHRISICLHSQQRYSKLGCCQWVGIQAILWEVNFILCDEIISLVKPRNSSILHKFRCQITDARQLLSKAIIRKVLPDNSSWVAWDMVLLYWSFVTMENYFGLSDDSHQHEICQAAGLWTHGTLNQEEFVSWLLTSLVAVLDKNQIEFWPLKSRSYLVCWFNDSFLDMRCVEARDLPSLFSS